MGTSSDLKAVFIISYDAYADAAIRLASTLNLRERHFLVLAEGGKRYFSEEKFAALQALGPTSLVEKEQVAEQAVQITADAFFLFFAGPLLEQTIRKLHAVHTLPPVCITCFAGILLHGQEAGFSQRLTSDIILFNSRRNFEDYQAFCARKGEAGENGMVLGFPAITGLPRRIPSPKPPERVVYVDQNVIPSSQGQRSRLAGWLVRYARHFPERQLKILCRDGGGNRSGHPGRFELPQLIAAAAGNRLPPNLTISTEGAAKALENCDLCIGISSTALIHAIARGIPTVSLSDFGCSAKSGTLLFRGSGLEQRFLQLLDKQYLSPPPHPEWLDMHLAFPEAHIAELEKKISDILAAGPRRLPNDALAHTLSRNTRLWLRFRRLFRPLKRLWLKTGTH